jgi:hypothetical protein
MVENTDIVEMRNVWVIWQSSVITTIYLNVNKDGMTSLVHWIRPSGEASAGNNWVPWTSLWVPFQVLFVVHIWWKREAFHWTLLWVCLIAPLSTFHDSHMVKNWNLPLKHLYALGRASLASPLIGIYAKQGLVISFGTRFSWSTEAPRCVVDSPGWLGGFSPSISVIVRKSSWQDLRTNWHRWIGGV